MKKKLGRPRQGDQIKILKSCRLQEKDFEKIKKLFGSFQKFIDQAIQNLK
jgi:hypothetical protein